MDKIISKIVRVFAMNFTKEELMLIEDSKLLKIKKQFSKQFTEEFRKIYSNLI